MPKQKPIESFHPFAAFLVCLEHAGRVLGRHVSLADLAEFSQASPDWENITVADLIIAADHYAYVNLEALVALTPGPSLHARRSRVRDEQERARAATRSTT